jgi:hypothetical protein
MPDLDLPPHVHEGAVLVIPADESTFIALEVRDDFNAPGGA